MRNDNKTLDELNKKASLFMLSFANIKSKMEEAVFPTSYVKDSFGFTQRQQLYWNKKILQRYGVGKKKRASGRYSIIDLTAFKIIYSLKSWQVPIEPTKIMIKHFMNSFLKDLNLLYSFSLGKTVCLCSTPKKAYFSVAENDEDVLNIIDEDVSRGPIVIEILNDELIEVLKKTERPDFYVEFKKDMTGKEKATFYVDGIKQQFKELSKIRLNRK